MKRFKNILYVNDPTNDQAWAIARAVSLAENKQVDLTVVDVIPAEVITAGIGLPPGVPISTDLKAAVMADHYAQLEALVKSYKQRLSIRLDMLEGNTYVEVIHAVLSNAYDLVIKPAENPNWLKSYLSTGFHLPKGPAKKMFPLLATELRADLVVLGTIVRTGISRLITGNTVETILAQLSCSVLAIKPPGFKTPVKLAE